nr:MULTISPECIES: hypothetical protein [Mycobacterium]
MNMRGKPSALLITSNAVTARNISAIRPLSLFSWHKKGPGVAGAFRMNHAGLQRDSRLFVAGDDLVRPFELVFDALACGLPPGPEFEVFKPIVAAIAVLVVHCLVWPKWAVEMVFHNKAMLGVALTFTRRAIPIACWRSGPTR